MSQQDDRDIRPGRLIVQQSIKLAEIDVCQSLLGDDGRARARAHAGDQAGIVASRRCIQPGITEQGGRNHRIAALRCQDQDSQHAVGDR